MTDKAAGYWVVSTDQNKFIFFGRNGDTKDPLTDVGDAVEMMRDLFQEDDKCDKLDLLTVFPSGKLQSETFTRETAKVPPLCKECHGITKWVKVGKIYKCIFCHAKNNVE